MKIKKEAPKVAASETPAISTRKCPKCQQDIPVSEWQEHWKLELLNPKWREEKMKLEERKKLNSLASGDEITQNLRKFAQERRDLFPSVAPQQE